MSNEVVLEVLQIWQNWQGSTAELYRDLDLSKGQMSALIRAGKRLIKNGYAVDGDFREVKIQEASGGAGNVKSPPCDGVELIWDNGRSIRFGQVEQLIEFLKKSA
jgi:hypothetical protein